MQHNDRNLLIDELLEIFEDGVGARSSPPGGESVRQRLDRLLDDFLLESQPIRVSEVTILLADLRGFTAITDSHPLPMVIDMLNRYFTAMSRVVIEHGGVIDKFMGDCIMALFGVPESSSDDLQRAVACAVHMQRAMIEVNRANERHGQPRLYAGIGLNTGHVMAGSFGSKLHNEYTVIGDAVNLAARIEAFSLRGQVLLSERVYLKARDSVEVGSVNRVMVKGKQEPIAMYAVDALTVSERIPVPPVEQRKSPRIFVNIPMAFRRVRDKRVLEETLVGNVIDLGYNGMCAQFSARLEPFSEILVSLPNIMVNSNSDLFAKLLRLQEHGRTFEGQFEFLGEDTAGHRAVKNYVDEIIWGR